METLKNGVLRVSGKTIDAKPFKVYFGKSSCGGKPHWALVRVADAILYEENQDFQVSVE